LVFGVFRHCRGLRETCYFQNLRKDQKPKSQDQLKEMNQTALITRFYELYGAGEIRVLRAPARINIIGEHIDYVSYLPTASLPFGSHEHAMWMAFRPNSDGVIRGASVNKHFDSFEFKTHEGIDVIGQNWNEYLFTRPVPASHWSNYVKGAVFFTLNKDVPSPAQGYDFLIDSTIPPQGGSSSSSALTVLAGAAMRIVNKINYSAEILAQDSAQAEWYIGTRGGSLDHTAICLSKRQHAVLLNYATNKTVTIPLPDKQVRWVTFFSHAADKGKEIMLEYNERAAVSRMIIPALLDGNISGASIKNLPEVISLAEVKQRFPDIFAQCLRTFPTLVEERFTQKLKIRSRAWHHFGEVERVNQAVEILQKNPTDAMQKLGGLMNASHRSLRDLYEVSTPDVNHLISIINEDSNVFGARIIGGGFGGNVLALTTADNVEPLVAHVQNKYYAPQQRDAAAEGAIMISTPGDGVSELTIP
jgi:galactokinase